MPDKENPYEDFLKTLAKLVEDIMNDLPDKEHAMFIGCTIVAGGIQGKPPFFHGIQGIGREIRYEIIESDKQIFITTQLPADIKNAPYADIDPYLVRICVDDLDARIPLPALIDVIHSFYMVRNGVMDVVLQKKPNSQDTR